jgi:CheY-like chemotaxis protein
MTVALDTVENGVVMTNADGNILSLNSAFTLQKSLSLPLVKDGDRLINMRVLDSPPPQRQKARVLIAEDNDINQKVAVRQLKKIGYTADVVSNGLAALDALEHGHYDIILMDCQMPEMDGYEATRRIRAGGNADSQPYIIAMTAHAMQGDKRQVSRRRHERLRHQAGRPEHAGSRSCSRYRNENDVPSPQDEQRRVG